MKKKLKKLKRLKGVTLLELIVVMAIFSGICVGALAMVRPAMQLHYKAAAQEKAVATVDTMARFIQDNLRYADKMFVFVNHGIKDIDTLCSYPFGFENFKNEIKFISQGGDSYPPTVGMSGPTPDPNDSSKLYYTLDEDSTKLEYLSDKAEIFIPSGEQDIFHFVNPVSAFAQYYFEESIYDRSEADKTLSECDEYYEHKVIYVMEIKNDTGEINIYSFPLAGDTVYYPTVNSGMTYSGTRGCSSISNLFNEGDEKVSIDKIDIGDDPSKGLKIDLSIKYNGATIKNLTLKYNIAVNFMNLTSGSDTIRVNDKYPYDAKRYFLFDWKDANKTYTLRYQELNLPTTPEDYRNKKDDGTFNEGYTYIVYSLPDIIP